MFITLYRTVDKVKYAFGLGAFSQFIRHRSIEYGRAFSRKSRVMALYLYISIHYTFFTFFFVWVCFSRLAFAPAFVL